MESFIEVHGLSSCDAQAPEHEDSAAVTCGISVTRPGVDPTTSPELQGVFLTTGPPEKFLYHSFRITLESYPI